MTEIKHYILAKLLDNEVSEMEFNNINERDECYEKIKDITPMFKANLRDGKLDIESCSDNDRKDLSLRYGNGAVHRDRVHKV